MKIKPYFLQKIEVKIKMSAAIFVWHFQGKVMYKSKNAIYSDHTDNFFMCYVTDISTLMESLYKNMFFVVVVVVKRPFCSSLSSICEIQCNL